VGTRLQILGTFGNYSSQEYRKTEQELLKGLPVNQKRSNQRETDLLEQRKEIGKNMRGVRERMRFTQVSLANKTGISQSKISKVELGELPLEVAELLLIMRAMKCVRGDTREVIYGPRGKSKRGAKKKLLGDRLFFNLARGWLAPN